MIRKAAPRVMDLRCCEAAVSERASRQTGLDRLRGPLPVGGGRRRSSRQWAGVTLIELLVAIAIVGILAQLAYPSYSRYVVRSNRSAVQQAMLDIANREEQFLLNSLRYGSLTEVGYSVPSSVSKFYDLRVDTTAGTPPSFVITATPKAGSSQSSDGELKLDSQGNRTPSNKW